MRVGDFKSSFLIVKKKSDIAVLLSLTTNAPALVSPNGLGNYYGFSPTLLYASH